MNRLKSLFLTSYITVASITGFHGLWVLAARGFDLPWLGATVAGLAGAGFFAQLFLLPVARTSANLVPLSAFLASAAALGISSWLTPEADWQPAAYSLFILLGWLAYIFWYSRYSHRESEILVVGKPLVSFRLKNAQDVVISSESFLGSPALFLFYRGNWCPFCTTQVKELAEQYRELDALGAQVVLVSPQPPGQTRKLAAKYEVPFHFLVDEDNQVARRLGIDAAKGLPAGLEVLGYDSDTVLPTVIITDEKGTILYADLPTNYRLRPEPSEFLRVLREAKAVG
ncbi:MAG: peroxiredoxin family protein [Deltaproteobacteria bacterium]|nr:peroxiredoxin family protein [Deltaproteobacteria bacterium]